MSATISFADEGDVNVRARKLFKINLIRTLINGRYIALKDKDIKESPQERALLDIILEKFALFRKLALDA